MGSALLLACAVVSGCSVRIAGVPVPADHDGPRPVAAAQLPDALLDSSTVADIMGTLSLVVQDSRSQMFDATKQFPDRDCLVAWMPAEQSVYERSGWTAMFAQSLWEADGQPDHVVIQAAVAFGSRDAARAFYDQAAQLWKPCGGRSFTTTTKDGASETPWAFDEVSEVDTTLWMTQQQGDSDGWGCQRALQVTNNVAIDVLACKVGVGDEAVTIANGIDAQLPSV
ncbi:sensor domain-containing protein [Mycobacterium sp. M1]|uniref:Sensor domain-containing protein n=1 Tax=Mycolicibacter acidiphilus TaxID=2835306 RepID=A0ABS5RJG4_9MYCO|nr:sensor domain-containing protein [Mycolicibacter acidiphilus]